MTHRTQCCWSVVSAGLVTLFIFTLCSSHAASGLTLRKRNTSTTLSPPTTTRRSKPIWNETYTDRLKHDILVGYDKFARPHEHFNTTVVTLALIVKHISFDVFASVMTVDAWIKMMWEDPKLRWNASEYGNMSSVNLPEHEIWQPDIVLFNSATPQNGMGDPYENTHAIVSSNGRVFWEPPSRLQVYCELDLTYWPFDTQHCDIHMGSWTYDYSMLNIDMSDESVVDLHVEGREWAVGVAQQERNVHTYPCCPEMYVDVIFSLTLHRNPGAYRAVIIAPASVAIILCLMTFWLPPRSGEKILLGGFNVLLICVFLIYFAHVLPVLTKPTPYVVLFYSWSLYLVGFSLVMAVLVLNLSRQTIPCPMPSSIKYFLRGPAARIFLLKPHLTCSGDTSELQETQPVLLGDHLSQDGGADSCLEMGLSTGTSRAASKDWELLAALIDRVVFLVYCFLFSVLAIAFSI